jgi:hypothetical protein
VERSKACVGHGGLFRKLSAIADKRSYWHEVEVLSLVLDKSGFQRLAEQPDQEQVRLWNHLHAHYQVVIPTILMEEVIVNVADPGPLPPVVVQEMMKSLLRLLQCWMDDVFEIAFREMVEEQQMTKLPPFPADFVKRVRTLAPDNPELLKWANERKSNRDSTVQTRMDAQDKLLPRSERREMADEKEFWIRLKNQFLKVLQHPENRRELLEVVFGETFRTRHPDRVSAVNDAFARFTHETFTRYYVTLSILMVRLAFMYAPLVHFKNGPSRSVRRFIGRSVSDQRNNAADEQYIVAAMICSRLLTRDEGMKNVIEMFRMNGFTKCESLYLHSSASVVEQILAFKN